MGGGESDPSAYPIQTAQEILDVESEATMIPETVYEEVEVFIFGGSKRLV